MTGRLDRVIDYAGGTHAMRHRRVGCVFLLPGVDRCDDCEVTGVAVTDSDRGESRGMDMERCGGTRAH